MTHLRPAPLFAVAAMLLLVTGCHVDTNKSADGKQNVDIGTPFGSMHVKTDDKANGAQTGLTPYPGATLVQKKDDDNGAADVNLSFGTFQLGVHAVDLRTADPEDKVLAFYKKDMARYGDVLTCQDYHPVGTPVRTSAGLTCRTYQHEIHVDDHDTHRLELRAGSEQHEHIVGLHTEDGATRIGLVALDLPGGAVHHSESDRE